jgi:phosphopantetheinyl transferase
MEGIVEVKTPVPGVRLYLAPVAPRSLSEVPLADPQEVATFATEKRRDEHLSGRWLLGRVLMMQGMIDLSVLEVQRSEERAPSLAFIQGVWRRTPLPSLSIAHSIGTVVVALGPSDAAIGVDIEPEGRGLASNAFDLIARGEELERLRDRPERAMRLWTGKEAVQKAMGMGMHLNPRDIEIPIEESASKITIGKSILQLDYWAEKGYHISLATRSKNPSQTTPEEALLEQTRLAMEANPDWGVGCNTQRNVR